METKSFTVGNNVNSNYNCVKCINICIFNSYSSWCQILQSSFLVSQKRKINVFKLKRYIVPAQCLYHFLAGFELWTVCSFSTTRPRRQGKYWSKNVFHNIWRGCFILLCLFFKPEIRIFRVNCWDNNIVAKLLLRRQTSANPTAMSLVSNLFLGSF